MKIVEKMLGDFLNFMILYFILIIMFAIVGSANFVYDLEQFSDLFASCLTVINTSIGSFSFEIFDIPNAAGENFLSLFGDLYTVVIVIIFKILILNFIIAILSNTYSLFDTKS